MEEMKNDPLKAIWDYPVSPTSMPIISADYLKGITLKFGGVDSSIWKKAKIYRNGIHTTVKWGDGTITRVKLTEGEEGNDVDAFLNALGKKLFGSRTALKRFVEQNTVIQKKKKKISKALDREGQEVKVGDAVYIPPRYGRFSVKEVGEIRKVFEMDADGKMVLIEGRNTIYPVSGLTKVKVKPPYSAGDYVVFENAEEKKCMYSDYWVQDGDNAIAIGEGMKANVPMKIRDISPAPFKKELNIVCGDERYYYYHPLWVRGLDE